VRGLGGAGGDFQKKKRIGIWEKNSRVVCSVTGDAYQQSDLKKKTKFARYTGGLASTVLGLWHLGKDAEKKTLRRGSFAKGSGLTELGSGKKSIEGTSAGVTGGIEETGERAAFTERGQVRQAPRVIKMKRGNVAEKNLRSEEKMRWPEADHV